MMPREYWRSGLTGGASAVSWAAERVGFECQPVGREPPGRRVPVSGVIGAPLSGAAGGPLYSLSVPGSVGSGRALRRTDESSNATERAFPSPTGCAVFRV